MHTEYTKINSHVQLCGEQAAKTRWPGRREWREGGGREGDTGAGEEWVVVVVVKVIGQRVVKECLGEEERCWGSDGGEGR